MAQVIVGGPREFDALIYGRPHPGTLNYLQSQLEQPSPMLTDMARQFFANSQELYERFHGAEAQRLAEAAVRKVKGIFQPNTVRSLWDLADLQQAPLVMQRWIMAMPEVREMYHQQRVDGFADTYVDVEPGQVAHNHYDWRRVNDGLVVEVADHSDYDWVHRQFYEELHEGDRDLTLEEKVDILNTWDAIQMYLRAGKDDPTSPVGGKL